MLSSFKKITASSKSAREQADALDALIATSREERAALSTMLTQIQLHSARLAAAAKSVQDVNELAATAHARLDEIAERIRQLVEAVTRMEPQASRAPEPDAGPAAPQKAARKPRAKPATKRTRKLPTEDC